MRRESDYTFEVYNGLGSTPLRCGRYTFEVYTEPADLGFHGASLDSSQPSAAGRPDGHAQ